MGALHGLAEKGFLLRAVLDVEGLPEWITRPIEDADVDPRRFQRLVMLGQGGKALWASIQASGFTSAHPFDDYSRSVVSDFVEDIGSPQHALVYPSDAHLPLGRMAAHVGWGRSSPLGLTINDRFGLWLAHRIVFLVDAPLETETASTTYPCSTCADTPCVTACPVGAVSVESGFDVDKCSHFRMAPYSPCADRCLARLACPVGTEHTYGEDLMRHHYASGLASIKQWYGS